MDVILKNHSLVLKAVVLSLVAGLIALAVRGVASTFDHASVYGPVILAAALLALAAGLWRMQEWARSAVVFVIWLLIIVVPLGRINPFAAADGLGLNPPSAWQLAFSIYPWVALGIFVLHVLGKHKLAFSKRAATQQGAQADGPASGGPAA